VWGVLPVSAYLPFVIFGLITGAIYGISAMGLVLTYKTSGVFNVAHGATSAVGAYIFYELRQVHGWPWPVAAAVAVLAFGPLSGLILERMAQERVTGFAAVPTIYAMLLAEADRPTRQPHQSLRPCPDSRWPRTTVIISAGMSHQPDNIFAGTAPDGGEHDAGAP